MQPLMTESWKKNGFITKTFFRQIVYIFPILRQNATFY